MDNEKEILKLVPKVYDDALKSTVQETGKTIALIPKAINVALSPLRKWIAEKEYIIAETEKLLAKKLQNIDQDKIVTPEAYVAIPAIQAISYSMNSVELRNLYANLLANSMNKDTKDNVHPSFVEIIKQMSPLDAKVFKLICESEINPLIDLSISYKDGGNNYYKYNISRITLYSYEDICISIDNLTRLGLIEIPLGRSYTNKETYKFVRDTSSYKRIKKELENINKGKIDEIEEDEKYIKKTSLAKIFYEMCIKDLDNN